jgi:hypothetical protein
MAAPAGLAQPGLGSRGDLPVIPGVAALSGASRGDEVLSRGTDIVGVAHQVRQIAHTTRDVHRQQAFDEAVVVFRVAAVMQLSDTGDMVAAVAESMSPTFPWYGYRRGRAPGASDRPHYPCMFPEPSSGFGARWLSRRVPAHGSQKKPPRCRQAYTIPSRCPQWLYDRPATGRR